MKKYRMQFYYENECEAESTTDATFKLVPELENWLGNNKAVFEIKKSNLDESWKINFSTVIKKVGNFLKPSAYKGYETNHK